MAHVFKSNPALNSFQSNSYKADLLPDLLWNPFSIGWSESVCTCQRIKSNLSGRDKKYHATLPNFEWNRRPFSPVLHASLRLLPKFLVLNHWNTKLQDNVYELQPYPLPSGGSRGGSLGSDEPPPHRANILYDKNLQCRVDLMSLWR
jgi:hypothetical protein